MPRSLVLALSVLALAGCGGGDDGGGGDGDTLALGKEATVEYTSSESEDAKAATTSLGVAVLAIRKGSQAELQQAGYEVDAEDEDTTPYYVDVRFSNKGDQAVPRKLGVAMEDSDGESVPTTLIFGFGDEPFDKCPHISKGMLKPGQSYEDCTLFLVPPEQDVGRVLFVSQAADAQISFTYWEPE